MIASAAGATMDAGSEVTHGPALSRPRAGISPLSPGRRGPREEPRQDQAHCQQQPRGLGREAADEGYTPRRFLLECHGVRPCGSARVRPCGSARVRPCGSARVRPCGSAQSPPGQLVVPWDWYDGEHEPVPEVVRDLYEGVTFDFAMVYQVSKAWIYVAVEPSPQGMKLLARQDHLKAFILMSLLNRGLPRASVSTSASALQPSWAPGTRRRSFRSWPSRRTIRRTAPSLPPSRSSAASSTPHPGRQTGASACPEKRMCTAASGRLSGVEVRPYARIAIASQPKTASG